MKTLRSYVCDRWLAADRGFVPLVNPATEEEVARASSAGVDFAAALAWARQRGGPALRAMTFAQRAELLKAMAKALREHRDELLDLSALNTGTTRPDGSFDVDGAGGTLSYYAGIVRALGDRTFLDQGDGVQLARTEAFWGRHVLVPRHGVAVLINAFNFPAWGWAEKVACAFAAGMPAIVKPATATAMVAERCCEIVIAAGLVPAGALQLVVGGTGDLLDRLGPQDVLAFTGSADTARTLRVRDHVLTTNVRLNVEADSLNAAVLAPDAGTSGATFDLFVRDVVREMTQKSGQKCTAVRRVLAPAAAVGAVEEALAARLSEVVVGNPADGTVTMGPLATAAQLTDALRGIGELRAVARLVHGSGRRADGVGSPHGAGFFLAPTLLHAEDPEDARVAHEREVFAPVATVFAYDGSPAAAAGLVAKGGGTLVTSVYGDDDGWLAEFLARAGATTGRLYVGSADSAEAAPGSGIALPASLHGGPGRAGGGAELGGLAGLELYLQKVAVQGSRSRVEKLAAGEPAGGGTA